MKTIKLRGQGTTCKGLLTIRLSGPQGVGKSLVAKHLAALLPLLMVDQVEIIDDGNVASAPVRAGLLLRRSRNGIKVAAFLNNELGVENKLEQKLELSDAEALEYVEELMVRYEVIRIKFTKKSKLPKLFKVRGQRISQVNGQTVHD